MNPKPCFCSSGKSFADCCQPLLLGKSIAQSPEQLMRSRYSAFCTGNIDYLIATHHPTKHKSDDSTRLARSIAETEWLGVRVLDSSSVRDSRQRGFVEFVAFYREKHFSTERGPEKSELLAQAARLSSKQPSQLHEKSEFIFEDGRWYYVQGLSLPPIRITRNDPCWCGSGKKFKQCHAKGK